MAKPKQDKGDGKFSFNPAAALGGLQVLGGVLLDKGQRPEFQIPGAAEEGLALARTQAAATTRPGNQYAIDQINKNAANQASTISQIAGSGTQALSALGRVEQNTNNQINQNNALNSQYRFNAQQNLQAVLGKFAGYQREKFIQDVMAPYQQRTDIKASLIGSGLQNVYGGLNMAAQNKAFAAMYGK